MPLTLVHVVPSLDTGGLEMLLRRLVLRQSKRWNVHVICLYGLGALSMEVERAGATVHYFGGAGNSSVGMITRLIGRLRRLRPDVIHTHNPGPILQTTLARPFLGRTVLIHTRHGQQNRADRLGRMVNRLSARWVSRAIAVSSDVALMLEKVEGFPKERITVLRNAVDVSEYRPARGPLYSAIAVGRMHPAKDYDTLLRATALVCSRHPEFRLRIAGGGAELGRLTTLAATLGLGSTVEFLGDRTDVPALLESSGLYVISSVSEGVPLTLLEAMASHLPIVTTRVGGIPEVVDDATAMLVPPSDPGALADAMCQLIEHPDVSARLAAAANERARIAHDIERLTRQYEEIYAGALDGR